MTLVLWMSVAFATNELLVPAGDDLDLALSTANLLGLTVRLEAGTYTVTTPLNGAAVQFVGVGPATVLAADGWLVQLSDLTLQDLTLDAGPVGPAIDASSAGLTLSGVMVDGDALRSVSASSTWLADVTQVQGSGTFVDVDGGLVVLTDVTAVRPLQLQADDCTLTRVFALCGSGSPAITASCTTGVVENTAISSVDVALQLAGQLTLRNVTVVDFTVAVASGGVLDLVVQDSLFTRGSQALDLSLADAATETGNLVYSVGDATGLDSADTTDPGLLAGACDPADLVFVGAQGFTTGPARPDVDGDGDWSWSDCDDLDAGRSAAAVEVTADGVDQDCDGEEDCFVDGDGDGSGTDLVVSSPVLDCASPGLSAASDDCDDLDPLRYPTAVEVCDGLDNDCGGRADDGLLETLYCLDADGDGFGDDEASTLACLPPPGYVFRCTDCDDDDPDRFPGGIEVAGDGVDQDCDLVDRPLTGVDLDGDGYCDGSFACEVVGDLPLDCDDADASVHPDALEDCGPVDRDCDGDPYGARYDADGDAFPSCTACPTEAVCDCNDFSGLARPLGDFDPCDGIDNDCDLAVDEDTLVDADGDGYGVGLCPDALQDCNDADPDINPGEDEDFGDPVPCVDRDCDGACEEDEQYEDTDGDGFCFYGVLVPGTVFCVDGVGPTDCDVDNPTVFPRDADFTGDVRDGLDNDCDGYTDEDAGIVDEDGDGAVAAVDCDDTSTLFEPGATELCDGLDNNCDGIVPATELDVDGDGWRACPEVRYGEGFPPDCDDTRADVHPYEREDCFDGLDNNCDGRIDLADDGDLDGDGSRVCDGDCNDDPADPNAVGVNPDAPERCNLLDDDCNGRVDDGFDDDADGGVRVEEGSDCELFVENGLPEDCDDTNSLVREGFPERCDGLDNDCDGLVDDGGNLDGDGDGVTPCNGDCDDGDPTIHPFVAERCDRIDHDCDGDPFTDHGDSLDVDGDGIIGTCHGDCGEGDPAIAPGRPDDTCNGVDDNCDGFADDGVVDFDEDGAFCDDCDDTNPAVYPDAEEICGNGVAEGCGEDELCPETGETGLTGETGGPTGDTDEPTDPAEPLPRGWFCDVGGGATGGWAGVVAVGFALGARSRRRSPACTLLGAAVPSRDAALLDRSCLVGARGGPR